MFVGEAVLGTRAGVGSSRRFYVWMASACLAIAVVGFMPTYFLPLAQGRFRAEPIVHIHGLVLFSWVAFFFTQTWLVATGRTLAHRTWGMLGIAIVTAMTCVITAVVSMRVAQASLPGQPAGTAEGVRAFAWVTIGGLAFIVPVFILAIVKLKDSEAHKRLILLMTVSMLGAPIARWFLTFLAPPPDPNAPPWPAGLPHVAAPPVFVAVTPALIGDILLVVAMVYDWRTRGRPHPVYLIGGGIMLLLHLTMVPVSNSPAWQAIAAAIGRLAG
ncbi:hypothetical protein [Phenylobacterium sp.]|uniref:hypothetical protein n=1 Tax=Phenylobacterium sp. TaxID=1871053 RepID=UPI0039C9F888